MKDGGRERKRRKEIIIARYDTNARGYDNEVGGEGDFRSLLSNNKLLNKTLHRYERGHVV